MIDSHVHVAAADIRRYPRQRRATGKPGWWDGAVGVEDLLVELDRSGVARAVLVHPVGVYGFDCRPTLDAASTDQRRLAAVPVVDPGGDPPADIAGLVGDPTVRALRLMAIEPWGTSWVREEVAGRMWQFAGAHDLPLLVVAGGAELSALAPVIAAHPDVPTILDNAGLPDVSGGRVPQEHPVLALADLPNVYVKVLTPLLLATTNNGGVIGQLAAAFGAERVAWGSNYPQTSSLTYGDMVALAREATASLGPTAQEAVLEATSANLWFGGL